MKLKINNKDIFASTGGRPFDNNKPVIIFLHGSGLDHTVWMLQTRYFAFHGYSVLALDLPISTDIVSVVIVPATVVFGEKPFSVSVRALY